MAEPRRLRFCLVTTFYPPFHFGGDGVFVHRLAHALGDRGHGVDVIHSEDAYRLQHPGDPEIAFAEHPRVRRHPLRSRAYRLSALAAHQLGRPARYGARLRAVLEREPYDVIHYHNVSLMGGPGVLRMGRGLKLYTPHEYWLICPTHVLFRFDREACTERRCLACTLHARRPPQLWRYGRLLADSIERIDRFLMPSRFALERHRADGVDRPATVLPTIVPAPTAGEDGIAPVSERPFFLFVGRLERLKGLHDVIPLFADYRAADLVVVGTGSQRPALEQLARGIDNVRFVGAIHPTEVSRYYRQAIAVLAPSLCYEVFPLVAAEAMAYGTPVIGRRIGAFTEVVEETGGGLVFSTPAECLAAMGRIQSAPEFRAELSRRARQAASNWTTDAHVDRYLGIVDELLAARGR